MREKRLNGKRHPRNERGQALIESILLFAMLAVVTHGGLTLMKRGNWFQRTIGAPWTKMNNLIQYGVAIEDKNKAREMHPANIKRHQTAVKD